jgi:transposase, IS5 family
MRVPTLWDAILPVECLVLPGEPAVVDRLLDDERFFEPFREHFDAVLGRPSIPIETYLRMMFLKHRYRLGFEPLCAEVSDSIAWRRFCRVPLGTRAPHPSTSMKITKRCGPALVERLNEVLLVKAHDASMVNLERVRADTTVVEASIAYPTDSGLIDDLEMLSATTGRVVDQARCRVDGDMPEGTTRLVSLQRRRHRSRSHRPGRQPA